MMITRKKAILVAVFTAIVRAAADDGLSNFFLACSDGSLQKVEDYLKAKPELANARTTWGEVGIGYEFAGYPNVDKWNLSDEDFGHERKLVAGKLVDVFGPKTPRGFNFRYDDDLALNARDHSVPPLHFACASGHKAVVELLLSYKADVNAKTRCGATPLLLAAEAGRTEIVELLLKNGAFVNSQNKCGRTPLHGAARRGSKAVAEILLAHGADVLLLDKTDRAPLQLCVDKATIQLLREHGATGPTEGIPVTKEMEQAVQKGDLEKVKKILESEPAMANGHYDKEHRWRILHEAVSEQRTAIVEELLINHADVAVQNNQGETPLHWAVRKSNLEIARLLFKFGATGGIEDEKRRTVLHEAAILGDAEMIELIVNSDWGTYGADAAGKTPLAYAIEGGHEAAANVLRKCGFER